VLLNDMWEWHMDTLHWTPVRDFQTAGGHRFAATCHTTMCMFVYVCGCVTASLADMVLMT
jgi:hypothetical protein